MCQKLLLACRAVALCEGWVLLLTIELSIGTLVGWVTVNGEIRMSNDEFLGFDHGSPATAGRLRITRML